VLYWLLFAFVAFGAKLLLALITIYLLFPGDRCCNQCDGETLLMRMGRAGRIVSRLLLGTIQWRWCPRCGWEGVARTGRTPMRRLQFPSSPKAPTRR
jgi:hypothetical protein